METRMSTRPVTTRPWMNARLPVARRVALLRRSMTLEEEAGQMSQYHSTIHGPALKDWIRGGHAGSLLFLRNLALANELQKIAVEESRLGVPLLFGDDVIHGFRTVYPIPLGEAASWDLDLIERDSHMAAREAKAAGIHWNFAPMVDVARDPRWGRIAEGAGEDPVLGAAVAKARIRGFQGDDLGAPDRVAACAKHFAAYGVAEGGRDYNTTDVPVRNLEEIFLPPFRAAVEAGVSSFMSAFNDLNGMPCTGNRWLLTDVLRRRWKFDGFVVSDWNSIGELPVHGVAGDGAAAATLAANAGADMDMVGHIYRTHLVNEVKAGRVSRAAVDAAVDRILAIKFRCGIFEQPYAEADHDRLTSLTPEHLEQARDAARKSIVLLKNEHARLPLAKDADAIAVIGPLAHDREAPLGTWSCEGRPQHVVTVLEGIEAKTGGRTRVHHEKGCEIEGGHDAGIGRAVATARASSIAVVVLGESALMSGEGGCRTDLGLPGHQQALLEAVHATGIPVVLVLLNGRPLALPWAAEHVDAIVEAWHPGIACGNAVADVLFGDHNPSAKLPASFPRATGQIPVYHARRKTGRPPRADDRTTSKYLDVANDPQWPFGFGLSYTTFAYANLRVTPTRARHPGTVKISVDVTNSGSRDGDEVVQLYLRDDVARLTRPMKELKGFRKIHLRPGERKRVTFELPTSDLQFRDERMQPIVEAGTFTVWVGPSSAEGLEGSFTLANTAKLKE